MQPVKQPVDYVIVDEDIQLEAEDLTHRDIDEFFEKPVYNRAYSISPRDGTVTIA